MPGKQSPRKRKLTPWQQRNIGRLREALFVGGDRLVVSCEFREPPPSPQKKAELWGPHKKKKTLRDPVPALLFLDTPYLPIDPWGQLTPRPPAMPTFPWPPMFPGLSVQKKTATHSLVLVGRSWVTQKLQGGFPRVSLEKRRFPWVSHENRGIS